MEKNKNGSEFRNFRAKKPKQAIKQRSPEREGPAGVTLDSLDLDQCHHSFHQQSDLTLHWSNPDTFGRGDVLLYVTLKNQFLFLWLASRFQLGFKQLFPEE